MKEIALTQGKVALVDDADAEMLAPYRWVAWCIRGTWYAAAEHGPKRIYMHRFITNAPDGMDVDHWSGDGLDNRRSNLRVCTHQQNIANQRRSTANTSGFKGVSWSKERRKWEAYIKVHQRKKALGRFDDAPTAARAYDTAAMAAFGEFARLNFPAA